MTSIDLERVEVLLFDLGGVIVPWVGIEALQELSGFTRNRVLELFSNNLILKQYEIGKCDDHTFAEELNSIFQLGLDLEATKTLWNSWVKAPYSNTETVIQSLRATYKTACLSNTNSLHWDHLHTVMDMERYFDIKLASHILNLAKPGAAIYEAAINALGVAPEKVIFFDDTAINVEAASNAGLQALHVDRAIGVIPKLKEIGLI